MRQRPWGTNYGVWTHPLTPYYRQKVGAEALPVHPKPGLASYRNWAGLVFENGSALRERARTVAIWEERNRPWMPAALHMGGWAMDNMKPRDFLWSRQPLFPLDEDGAENARRLVEAANAFAFALTGAVRDLTRADAYDATAVETVREAFFTRTQSDFETMLGRLSRGEAMQTASTDEGERKGLAEDWRRVLRRVALDLFDERALPGLDAREAKRIETIVAARDRLRLAFSGWGEKTGKTAFGALGFEPPKRRARTKEAA